MAENAGTIDSLLVSLGLETDAKSFEKGATAIKSVTDGMLQLAAIAGVGMGMKALTSGVANSALEMQRLSNNTGFTIRQIQGLEMAMRRLNLSPDAAHDIAKMIPDLQRKARFGELNDKAYWNGAFNPGEFANMAPDQGLQYLSDAYQKMNRDQRAFLQEGAGLGRDSPITRLLEMGPKFLSDSQVKSDANPYKIDAQLLKNSQIFNDEMADLSRNFEVLAYSMGSKLLPIVNSVLDVINSFIKENPGVSQALITAGGVAGAAGALKIGGRLLGFGGGSSSGSGAGWLSRFLLNPFTVGAAAALTPGNAFVDEKDARAMSNPALNRGRSDGGGVTPYEAYLRQKKGGDLHGAIDNPNARAYLDAISRAEGTAALPGGGYNTMFGGEQFGDLSDHPRVMKPFRQTDGTMNQTSAAGRYQFTQTSWDEASQALGLTDFSPRSQDMAALWLIQRAGQLDNVLSGDFMTATNHLGGVWASLPSSPYAQPKRSQEEMENYYMPDYVQRRSQAPYNPSVSRSESSQPAQVTQRNEFNISGLGLDEKQVRHVAEEVVVEAANTLERSFNKNRG